MLDSNYDVNANTKLYLKLNGDSTDSSGNGYNGTDANISYVAGRFGQCASFNGTSSRISGTGGFPQVNTARTLSIWVNKVANAADSVIFEYGTRDTNKDFILFMRSNALEFSDYGGTSGVFLTPTNGVWYNITVVINGTAAKIYVNGVLATTRTKTFNTTGSNFSIGSNLAGAEWAYYLVDEVIIENAARTAQQVLNYYNKAQTRYLGEYIGAGSGVTKGLWHLNGNSNDSSGNGNNGTDAPVTVTYTGNYAKFNGSSSKVTIADNNTLDLTGDQTYVMWVRLSSQPGTGLQFRLFDNSGSSPYGTYISYAEWTGMKLSIVYGAGASTIYPQTLTNGVRYMLGLVHSDTGDYDEIFVNGVSIGKATGKTANPAAQTTSRYLGCEGGSGKWFPGDMRGVIVENRVRTPTMMQKHYTYAKGRFGIL